MNFGEDTMSNYSFVKNWSTIGEQSEERERSTKTFTNGWQLHRTGIEPMSIAWKATMLPLHQRCSHLVIIQWETVLLCQKLIDDRREKVQRENAAPKQSPTDHNCIVRESTHVNSLKGYYATAIPTMLTWTLVKKQWVTILLSKTDRRSESKVQRENAAPKHLLTDDNCIVRESNPCQ